MLTSADVLTAIDNCYQTDHGSFITLEHPYVFTIDSRINIFKGDNDRWAVAGEVLGYNPRGDVVSLQVFYFGNCLINLKSKDDYESNSCWFYPVDFDQLQTTITYEALLPDAKYWLVRGVKVPLSHKKKDYADAGIQLQEYEPGEIRVEEAARLAIIKHAAVFRATDEELYKSIPADLKKILVLDEWYHREFYQSRSPFAGSWRFEFQNEHMQEVARQQLEATESANLKEWENNRPGAYETWQQLANVIATGDISLYKPTLAPNSHWINWPEAGSL